MSTITREMAVEWLRELGWRFAPEYGSEIITHDDAVFVVDGGGHKEDTTPYMVNLLPLIQKAYDAGGDAVDKEWQKQAHRIADDSFREGAIEAYKELGER